MKNIIFISLIIVVSSSFGQGDNTSISGFYKFEDPIGTVTPYWKQLNYQDSIIFKGSRYINKSKYRTTLNYFDSLGFMYKSEKWIENRKKNRAHLVSHSDYKIKFDSLSGDQVETGNNNYNYHYYDSIKFKADGTLEYRYKVEVRKLDGIKWDTVSRLNVQLISNVSNIKKYEINYGAGRGSIGTYINNRPVYFKSIIYSDTVSDTIIYNTHEDYSIVNYFFKSTKDSMYQIGEIDSLSNGLLQEKKSFERYSPTNFKRENYFYDKEKRLVLKTASRSRIKIEVHEYVESGHNRYVIDNEEMIKTSYTKFKRFPFLGWKLSKSQNN